MELPRNAQIWLPGYLRSCARNLWTPRTAGKPVDVLLCIADHFEPDHGGAGLARQRARVRRWLDEYPRLAAAYRDADGRGPQHTFFSPLEVYEAEHLDALAEITAAGFAEVEVHLHHADDTSSGLRVRLECFRETLAVTHGLLGTDAERNPRYGFVHGNWALHNGRPDGKYCGVNDELTILRETGCYADYTMPAAPDPAQSRIVNTLYYATGDPRSPRSYDRGRRIRVHGRRDPASLPLVQGPLLLRWDRRTGRQLPRIDNGAIDASPLHQPTVQRFRSWVRTRISVEGRPDWVFVKVHTHGAKDANADILLGDVMHRFHDDIGREFNDGFRYRLHYVTAREMFNILKAAEDGHTGNPGAFRDYVVRPPAVAARRGPCAPADSRTRLAATGMAVQP